MAEYPKQLIGKLDEQCGRKLGRSWACTFWISS